MSNARNLSRLPQLGAGNATLMKNRIINGDMRIDQRRAGASVNQTDTGIYTLDRWNAYGTANAKFSLQQNAGSVTPPVGYKNYLGCTSLAATSLSAGDIYLIQQNIEGYNVADLAWGTASAKTVTLSFWVRSSLTGTFGGSFTGGNSRNYPFSYTVSAANTWEQKSITMAGDTSGTWGSTNGTGLIVNFSLGMGSNYSNTAGVWTAAASYSVTGATSVVGTSGATFYITGVQLEVGSSDTGFEYRQFGQELALCQRYYEVNNSADANGGYYASVSSFNTTQCRFGMIYQVPKRAQPSITFSAGSTFNLQALGGNVGATSFTTVAINKNNFYAYATGTYTANVPYMLIDQVSTSFINISAEL